MKLKRSAGAREWAGTVEVTLHRRNPKNAKKRYTQTDRHTHGKPPIRVLMSDRKKTKNEVEAVGGCMRVGGYRRNTVASSKPKKCEKALHTDRQTDRHTENLQLEY